MEGDLKDFDLSRYEAEQSMLEIWKEPKEELSVRRKRDAVKPCSSALKRTKRQSFGLFGGFQSPWKRRRLGRRGRRRNRDSKEYSGFF